MIERKEYKFIKIDRFNAICSLDAADIAYIKNNIVHVKFDLAYIVYLNFEITFKPYEQFSEKLIPAVKISKGFWAHNDSHLAETFKGFLKENTENYDSPIILKARIYHTFNKKY